MSTYTIRPNSVINMTAGTSPSVQATVLSYLSDNSDSTVVTNTGTQQQNWVFGLAAPTILSTEFVARVSPWLRYKGASSYSIGAIVYRSTDSRPTGYYSMVPNSASAFATQQLYLQPAPWTLAEVASLRMVWIDNRTSTSFPVTEHADIWATVQTLALATATSSAVTESSSVFPTIPVTVATTIDWESTTYDWQNLRKVTAEVRIESGGIGVGTGTLMTQTSANTLFTATGSQTLNIVTPDPLPNGTYKVYVRALRYREDGVIRDDQYSAWSSAYTLTMSAPLPATPTVSVSADNSSDTVTVSVTPVSSASYAGPYIYIERSDDAGSTWSPVRHSYGVAGTFGTASNFIDYEAPRGTAVQYRARIEATYSSAFINAGLWSTPVSAYLNLDTWNLKVPDNADLNAIGVNVTGRPTEQVEEDLGIFRPLGRKYPVVVAGTLSGWDGELTVVCSTTQEWADIRALVDAQTVLLLESVFGWSKYVRLISGLKSDMYGTSTSPKRNLTLTYVEVDRPTIVTGDTSPTITVPSVIDGGAASASFGDFYDGGTSTSTYIAIFDGGAAV